MAIGVNRRSNVKGRFHPPFNFIGDDPRFFELAEEGSGTHIVGAKNRRALFVLHHREELPGALLLHEVIAPAAGLGAAAPVAASSSEEGRNHAPPGVGHTHGAVDEGFNLHILGNPPAKLGNILNRKLPGDHHPSCAHFVIDVGGIEVHAIRLGADVDFKLRRRLVNGGNKPKVRDDDRVRPGFIEKAGVVRGGVNLLVSREAVRGDVELDPVLMSIFYGFGDALPGEAHVVRPKLEKGSADIYGVGAEMDCRLKALHISRRREKFRF